MIQKKRACDMKRYVWLFHDSKTMNNFYYNEMTGNICLLENQKSGSRISIGVIAGLSILIYVIGRRIEKPVSIDKDILYWISLGIGVALGIVISAYGVRRAKRKVNRCVRMYPCSTEEKQEMARQNHRWFLRYLLLFAVMTAACAAYRFLMLWIAPSVSVYAFFNALMCMITILLIAAFANNRPLKGWKIANKILKKDLS